jgi:hypothetical protein
MARFEVGDTVQMPGIPIRVKVLELGTCEDGADCDLGGEMFRFKDPQSGEDDWYHSAEFVKV